MAIGDGYPAGVKLFTPYHTSNRFLRDISPLAWPSYRRITLAKGGDHSAYLILDEAKVGAELLGLYFSQWLGYQIVEEYGGVDTFRGIITALRLNVGGTVLGRSLDNVYNDVRVRYDKASTDTGYTTTAATDADSVALFGTRELVYVAGVYMSQTLAETVRDNILARAAFPRTVTVDTDTGITDDLAFLEIEVSGGVHSLGWVYHFQASIGSSNVTLNTHVYNLVGLSDYLTRGNIETHTLYAVTESDYVTAADRIADLAEEAGYLYGTRPGTYTFDYYDPTAYEGVIAYRRQARDPARRIYSTGRIVVPPALVRPARVVWTDDLLTAPPVTTALLDDPRASFIYGVEFDINGARLIGSADPEDYGRATEAALALEIAKYAEKSRIASDGDTAAAKITGYDRNQ